MSNGVRCMWMRGGTSKGGYFLKDDLPADVAKRNAFLLRIMGSPDIRQIDGMGGADPLTSKVAVISKSQRDGVDVDYLFLQIFVDQEIVTDVQNCGNILAGVGPFAIERGLVVAQDGETPITIFMENTKQLAVATVSTPSGEVCYSGDASIGVLGAVSVATACLVQKSRAADVAQVHGGARKTLSIEHPTGEMTCILETDKTGSVISTALLRTARKLMDGEIFA